MVTVKHLTAPSARGIAPAPVALVGKVMPHGGNASNENDVSAAIGIECGGGRACERIEERSDAAQHAEVEVTAASVLEQKVPRRDGDLERSPSNSVPSVPNG